MSIKKKIIFALFRQHKRNQAKLHDLTYLFWECTLRCNLNCIHCGSDCSKEALVPDMPLADFLKVLDSITPHVTPSNTMIVLTGGEPLMRPDLEACGKAIAERGFPWGMVTNGFALSPSRFASLLDAGLRSITISMDGLNAVTHDWFRGKKDSWTKAIAAAEMVAHTPNLMYDVVTCVNQRSIDHLEDIYALLLSKGVNRWRLFTIFPKGRAKEHAELQLSQVQFIRLMEFIKQARTKPEMHVSYGCEGYLGKYELEVRDNPFYCQAGIHIGSVLADGAISACPSLRADYIQGNIYTDDFWTVWNTRYQNMRNRQWTRTGKCATCSAYKDCEGNGLHLRDENSGELLCCHMEMSGQ